MLPIPISFFSFTTFILVLLSLSYRFWRWQDLQVIDSPLSLVHLPYFFPTYQEDERVISWWLYIAPFPLIRWGGVCMLENLGKLQEVSSLCFWVRENFLTTLFVWTWDVFPRKTRKPRTHNPRSFFFFTQVTQ